MKFQVMIARPEIVQVEAGSPEEATDKALASRDEDWEVMEVRRELEIGDPVMVLIAGKEFSGECLGIVRVYCAQADGQIVTKPNAEERIELGPPLPPHAELFEATSPKFQLEDGRVVFGCQVLWRHDDGDDEDEGECVGCGLCGKTSPPPTAPN